MSGGSASLAWALGYAMRGWHVFPILPGQRTPLVTNGQNAATTDPVTIERWWREWPAANVGIHARPSGLYVIDLDVKHGHRGDLAWASLVAENGDIPTYTVRTGTGGVHLYYAAPAGHDLTNTAGRLGDGIDTRGNGYVVAPPSVVEGRPYSVLVGIDPVPLPGWVVEKLGARVNGARPAPAWTGPSQEVELFRPPDVAVPVGPPAPVEEVAARIRMLAEGLAAAPDGQGNDTAARVAFLVGQYVGAGQCDREYARRALQWAVSRWTWARQGDHERMLRTIDSQLLFGERSPRTWVAEGARFPGPGDSGITDVARGGVERRGLRVDLGPLLDGSFRPPEPSVGAERGDSGLGVELGGREPVRLLYAGMWHTVIGPTGCGKSWFLLTHAVAELHAGRSVVYAHFEETSPMPTIARLRAMGVGPDVIRERFVWLDGGTLWRPGDLAGELAALPVSATLVLLDGIDAACTLHGFDPDKIQTVGWYRHMFVTPATATGAAVISAGHPVKAATRQDERGGSGSGGWLNLMDGVCFRMRAGQSNPVLRGRRGFANLWSAKDRHGGVERHGVVSGPDGWKYLGSLCVDDGDPSGITRVTLVAPRPDEVAATDPIDALGQSIVQLMESLPERRYESQNSLEEALKHAKVKFTKGDIGPALFGLESLGLLERDPEGGRRARAGWLTSPRASPNHDQ